MRFRKRLFTGLALLVLILLAGIYLSYASTEPTEDVTSEDAFNLGKAAGFSMFACVLLPLFALFALLGWRNSVGLRSEQRHREQLDALRTSRGEE